MQRTKRNQNNKKRTNRKQDKNLHDLLDPHVNIRVPRSLRAGGVVPSEQIVKFSYVANILIASSVNFLVYDFRMNNVTLVDPLVSTSSATGVPFWSVGYSQYRVLKTKVNYSFITNEPSTPQTCGFTFKDPQPSAGLTNIDLATRALNFNISDKIHPIGQTTGTSVYRSPSYSMSPAAVLGDPLQYFTDNRFTGNFTTGPSQTIWMSFILINNVTANVGGLLTVNFSFTTRVYSPSFAAI
jgi:hypothetical protein